MDPRDYIVAAIATTAEQDDKHTGQYYFVAVDENEYDCFRNDSNHEWQTAHLTRLEGMTLAEAARHALDYVQKNRLVLLQCQTPMV